MLCIAKTGLVALTLTASALTFGAVPAQAATDFANCAAMHRTFKAGVAKSVAAAHRQERSGHKRPAVRPALYRVNIESDADRDGTACEIVDR